MDTPYDKLKSLANAEKYLRDGITFEMLDSEAFTSLLATYLEEAQELRFRHES